MNYSFKKILAAGLIFFTGFAWGQLPCSQECKVYLTIDDGPLAGARNIISAFSQKPVPVTLFMVGLHVEEFSRGQEMLALAKAMPNVKIGDHSYSHARDRYRYFYSDAAGVVKDMQMGAKVLGIEATKPIFSRLPGRNVFRLQGLSRDDPYITAHERALEKVDDDDVRRAGFSLYGWDLEWAHLSSGKPVQSIANLLEEIQQAFATGNTVRPGKLILLMHDQMFPDHFDGQTQLLALIQALQDRGYVIDDLRNY